jgi:hypothetical protein
LKPVRPVEAVEYLALLGWFVLLVRERLAALMNQIVVSTDRREGMDRCTGECLVLLDQTVPVQEELAASDLL